MQTIVLYLCYIVLILLFSTAYCTSLIYCFVIWCLHTNKRRPCSSTLSGHPSSSLLASKSGFSHRVNPYSLHMLKRFFFAIPHQLVQVNSWDMPNDSFRMRLIISYHIWSVYAPLFSYLEQISNWDILKSTEFHCQATGRKRGQGRFCDDAFGILVCPVLGVFGGVFCPPSKLSGFCLFLVVSTLQNKITISLLGPRPNRADHSQSRLSGGLYFQV